MGLSDLSVHAFRLIPNGTNSPSSPWTISINIHEQDSGIAPLVIPEAYKNFAKALNQSVEWDGNSFEIWMYWILLALWYPMASEYLSWRRDVRAARLVTLVRDEEGEHHHQMLSGHRARVLHNCLRLNISDDCTMFWLDVLYRETTPPPVTLRRSIGAPRLPMLLCLAGDGTSRDPLHLDLNDVLINSIPQLTVLSDFIDNRWVDFILSLNENLRTVDCDHLSVTIEPVLRLIDRSNDTDYLKGIHLQLVLMWPNSTSLDYLNSNNSNNSNDENSLPCKYTVNRKEARLAIHISKGKMQRRDSRSRLSNGNSNSNSATTSPPLSPIISPTFSNRIDNDKTWKFSKRKSNSKINNKKSIKDVFSSSSSSNAATKTVSKNVTKTVANATTSSRPMSIRDRMLGSDGNSNAAAGRSTTTPTSPTKNSRHRNSSLPPLSPSAQYLSNSSREHKLKDSFQSPSRRTTLEQRRQDSSSTLTAPHVSSSDSSEPDEFTNITPDGAISANTTSTGNASSSVEQNDIISIRRTRSLTAYHEGTLKEKSQVNATAEIYVSEEFTLLDYAAIQTLKVKKREMCSRDKCAFQSVIVVALVSFCTSIVLFSYSVMYFPNKLPSPIPNYIENDRNIDWYSGVVFVSCALVLLISHVGVPRSFQINWCASHMTNVMTRNR